MTLRLRANLLQFLALICTACVVETPPPATPASPSAEGAALAGELAELASQVSAHAGAIQAASDPERLVQDGPVPDVEFMKRELAELQTRMEEIEGRLAAMEALAGQPAISRE